MASGPSSVGDDINNSEKLPVIKMGVQKLMLMFQSLMQLNRLSL